MAEQITKHVEIVLSGRDGTGPAVASAQRALTELQTRAKATEQAAMRAPARLVNRSAEDQAARDMVAGRMRAMRDAAGKARVRERADEMMYGPRASTAAPMPGLSMDQMGRAELSGRSAQMLAARERRTMGGGGATGVALLAQQGELANKYVSMLKGAGALMVAAEAGRAMQALATEIGNFRDRANAGMPAIENLGQTLADTVPVAGDLAKGMRSLYDSIAHGQQIARDREKEELKAIRDRMRARQQEKVAEQERRTQAMAREAEETLATETYGDPNDRDRRAIRFRQRREMEDIATARRAPGRQAMTSEQIEEDDRRLKLAEMAATRRADLAMREVNKREAEQRTEAQREQAERRREQQQREAEAFAEAAQQAEQQAQAMADRIRENVMSSRIESAPLERGENRLLVGARSMGDGERDWQREVANGLAAALRELRSSNANLQRVERAVGQGGLQVSQMTGP
jgi:hypothetical protein